MMNMKPSLTRMGKSRMYALNGMISMPSALRTNFCTTTPTAKKHTTNTSTRMSSMEPTEMGMPPPPPGLPPSQNFSCTHKKWYSFSAVTSASRMGFSVFCVASSAQCSSSTICRESEPPLAAILTPLSTSVYVAWLRAPSDADEPGVSPHDWHASVSSFWHADESPLNDGGSVTFLHTCRNTSHCSLPSGHSGTLSGLHGEPRGR
mmetsp:Transcript_11699/g.28510  ORF Transcript_11699/g.28510 Transcript_11699/m.28510 type:complete len:205 (-) Transcript_11699:218-832(-)